MTTYKRKVATREEFTRAYLEIFSGSLSLTNKELEVLVHFLVKYTILKEEKVPDKYITKFLFSEETRKEVKGKMSVTNHSLNNFISSMKKKGIFQEHGEDIYIAKHLIPEGNIQFIIEYDNQEEVEENTEEINNKEDQSTIENANYEEGSAIKQQEESVDKEGDSEEDSSGAEFIEGPGTSDYIKRL